MSEPLFEIEVDNTALLAALEEIPEMVLAFLKPAAKITADRIREEGRARIKRRTGATGDAITVEETHNGDGYVVFVGGKRAHIGRYLAFGTKFMVGDNFLFTAARIEEGPHDDRTRAAVQAAIDAEGLGD